MNDMLYVPSEYAGSGRGIPGIDRLLHAQRIAGLTQLNEFSQADNTMAQDNNIFPQAVPQPPETIDYSTIPDTAFAAWRIPKVADIA